jgi:excisionase family DNA binding protein
MSAISIVRKRVSRDNESKPQKDYMTTTELSKLCGVSRFTIINWTNEGKIKANRTVGGHYRIPVSEAMSFLETFHTEVNGVASHLPGHCWEYPQKTNCSKECGNCLIFGKEVDYCFVLVRQFGKGQIRCKGNCLSCGYFEEFFKLYSKETQFEEPHGKKTKGMRMEKRNFLYKFGYGAGRSMQELKDKAAGLREKFVGRPRFSKRMVKRNA